MSIEQLERREDLFEDAGEEPQRWAVFVDGVQKKIAGRQEWRSLAAAFGAVHSRLRRVSLAPTGLTKSADFRRPDKGMIQEFCTRHVRVKYWSPGGWKEPRR